MINIKGLDKARVLVELYNHSHQQGLGMFQAAKNLTVEDARELLKNQTYFDYLYGKVMKIDLSSDEEFSERLYDRDNGEGMAKSVIDNLRRKLEHTTEVAVGSQDIATLETQLSTLKSNNNKQQMTIEDATLKYEDYARPRQSLLVDLPDGRKGLLTVILDASERQRIALQDFQGNEIKTVIPLIWETAYMAKDKENIYVFTSNSKEPKMYILDKQTFQIKNQKMIGRAIVQGVCCNDSYLYTFNMDGGKIEIRDKTGSVLNYQSVSDGFGVSNHYIAATSSDVKAIPYHVISKMPKNIKTSLASEIGDKIMELNAIASGLAYDESKDRIYISSENLIFVLEDDHYKGLMYFKDKKIMGLDFDVETGTLMVSAINKLESEKTYSWNSGGTLEVISAASINKKIEESTKFLIERNKAERKNEICNLIVNMCNGNLDIMLYLIQKYQELGQNVENIIEDIASRSLPSDQIVSEFNNAINSVVESEQVAFEEGFSKPVRR